MAVIDVTGYMECCCETGDHNTHYEKAPEVDLIQILWIQKQIGDPQVFSEISGDHG